VCFCSSHLGGSAPATNSFELLAWLVGTLSLGRLASSMETSTFMFPLLPWVMDIPVRLVFVFIFPLTYSHVPWVIFKPPALQVLDIECSIGFSGQLLLSSYSIFNSPSWNITSQSLSPALFRDLWHMILMFKDNGFPLASVLTWSAVF